jgi:hypothetical protein
MLCRATYTFQDFVIYEPAFGERFGLYVVYVVYGGTGIHLRRLEVRALGLNVVYVVCGGTGIYLRRL